MDTEWLLFFCFYSSISLILVHITEMIFLCRWSNEWSDSSAIILNRLRTQKKCVCVWCRNCSNCSSCFWNCISNVFLYRIFFCFCCMFALSDTQHCIFPVLSSYVCKIKTNYESESGEWLCMWLKRLLPFVAKWISKEKKKTWQHFNNDYSSKTQNV